MSEKPSREQYAELLKEYCETGGEEILYRASLLSQAFIADGIPPDEIVALHTEAVQHVVRPYDPRSLVASQQMLLEVMIAYGVRYSEYAEFRLAEAKKAVESEHGRADAATKAERERLELLAVISHELGTPLTVARGNVAAIRRFLGENNRLSHDLASRAIDAEVAIERLLTLREELVAASRNEPRELELAPLNLDNAIRRALKWAEPAAKEKNIELVVELTAQHPVVVGEPDALQSIFGNLLSNAIRYTSPGGTVTVRTRREGTCILVEVRDTGIGMSDETLEHLFERFYRAPEARQMASWGLGLGLAIANELAVAIDADIHCESEVGCGTVFTVKFPEATPEKDQL